MVMRTLRRIHAWWDYHLQWCLFNREYVRKVAIRHQAIGHFNGRQEMLEELLEYNDCMFDFFKLKINQERREIRNDTT